MLEDTCSVCGLPQELCVCGDIEKTGSVIEVKSERRKYGKIWVVVTGIQADTTELKDILKKIKNKLACAGTIKGRSIEILYGRKERTKELIEILSELGFNKDSIHVTEMK
ncbi:MAG: stress response translation initiation inhibitor YciH [Candidatus Woesearchaeota archaeon]|jgi:translation initiation factor 1|nr:stress response translation initiation inhibitor YciH [Candidatus Woesearchaeota archaeon]